MLRRSAGNIVVIWYLRSKGVKGEGREGKGGKERNRKKRKEKVRIYGNCLQVLVLFGPFLNLSFIFSFIINQVPRELNKSKA